MSRRFLYNNDGDILLRETDDYERLISEAVQECPPNLTTYLMCPGAGKLNYPSRVGDMTILSRSLVKAIRAGKDPFGMFLWAMRQAGKETLITLRMNDVHNPHDANAWNLPKVRREHPDCIVDPEGARKQNADWLCYCLDYTRPEVRDYTFGIICELLERYEVDGLELDWMRFPRHLSGSPEEVWAKRNLLTHFTEDVRALARGAGKKLLLSARIPTSLAACRYLGLDIAAWTRGGLVDWLVPSPFLTSDFTMPLAELRAELGAFPVPIYADIEFTHGTQHVNPESLRAIALSLFDCGADGIYLFNFPCWQSSYLASNPTDWLRCLHEPELAAQKPLLFSLSYDRARIPNVDQPGVLPARLPAGQSVALNLYLPKGALPTQRGLLLVHSCGDIAVTWNGQALRELTYWQRAELFVEYIDHEALTGFRPRKEDCRLFDVDLDALQVGPNQLLIGNRAEKELQIARVNLGLW